MTSASDDRDRFYSILAELQERTGCHCLGKCNGRMGWPRQGVYFFFEPGEFRSDGTTPRVVRVGTHAVSAGSRTTLWNRLSTHRGVIKTGGGNHRGSIFRLHVGAALLSRDEGLVLKPASWGHGSSASRDIREAEHHVERAVSDYIGQMPFLWIKAEDSAARGSIRSFIESNAIRLLSRVSETGDSADPPSPGWLGLHCPNAAIQRSALWNVQHTAGKYEPDFLDLIAECAGQTEPLAGG